MALKRHNRGSGHTYELDGRPVGGVTTILGKGMPKPALPYWSARTVAEFVADAEPDVLDALRTLGRDGMIDALKNIPWGQRNRAGVRGTEVHKFAERLARGDRLDVPDHLAGHVDSLLKFLDTWRPAPVLTEAVVGSRRWRYAGTLDVIADLPDGRRVLLDYKTSASGIWPETALQLSAYRHADFYLDGDGREQPMETVGINGAYAVWLRADDYQVIPVATSCVAVDYCRCGDKPVFDTFLRIARVAAETDEGMPTWVGAPEPWAGVAA